MAIDGLELREQYIVKMRFFSGITNEKIAATLGIHPTRISHMMPEIVEKLRRKLWGYYAAANH
jgi:DNA-directed RNA polymerase specialized sigma subunit